MRSQVQRAGDDAVQVQASGDVYIGVTEERAHEIARTTATDVIAAYAEESHTLIQERVLKLDDRTIAALIRAGRLEAFADPGFERTYRRAQEGAACTERDSDYDILAALLTDRASRGSDRLVRAGVERAIEIVDQIDDSALRGVTVLQAVIQFAPLAGQVGAGLDALDGLFEDLLDGPLPLGADWLEHLDILDVVRVDPVQSFINFADFYPAKVPGYYSKGLPQENFEPVLVVDGTHFAWGPFVEPHELRAGYVRVASPNSTQFETLLRTTALPDTLKSAILAAAKETLGLDTPEEELKVSLMDEFHRRPSLHNVIEWWDQLPTHAQVTSVGRVVARANAYRLDSNSRLPALG